MRTTVAINDSLLEQAKAAARQRNLTLGAYIEESIRHYLLDSQDRASHTVSLRTAGQGGVLPGIDLTSNASLFEAIGGFP